MNAHAPFMRLHGLRMADAGYSLVPIAAGQKWPGEYQNGKWWNLKGWEFLALTKTPEALIDNVWSNYPGCGVGIACGGRHLDEFDSRAGELTLGLLPVAAVRKERRAVPGHDQRADAAREPREPGSSCPALGQIFGEVRIGRRNEQRVRAVLVELIPDAREALTDG